MKIKQWIFNIFKKEILSAVGYKNVAIRMEHIKPSLISASYKINIVDERHKFTTQETILYDSARSILIRSLSEYVKTEWSQENGERSVKLSLYVAKPL